MNWLTLHELLSAQIKTLAPLTEYFAIAGELDAEFEKGASPEKAALAVEQQFLPQVEKAIERFASDGTWPHRQPAAVRTFITARLKQASALSARLAVPLSAYAGEGFLRIPDDMTQPEVLRWLLLRQWNMIGRDAWVAGVRELVNRAQTMSP